MKKNSVSMKWFRNYSLIVATVLCVACSGILAQDTDGFKAAIERLQNYFHIPGIALGVIQNGEVLLEEYMGFADVEAKSMVDGQTVFPIASVTKTYSMIPVMHLVDQGLIVLDSSVKYYLPEINVAPNITVRNVLSHTSEFVPGTMYNYSPRMGVIKQIAEQVSGKSFEQLVRQYVVEPAGVEDMVFMHDKESFQGVKVAAPYTYYGSLEKGQYDFGFGATAGLATSLKSMIKIDAALDNQILMPKALYQEMTTPARSLAGVPLPYGLGVFTGDFLGHKCHWSYGQYECFSSLYLKIPNQNLTLIILANNSFMSDPPRLIYGDVRYSLFALALARFILDEFDQTQYEKYAYRAEFMASTFMAQGVESAKMRSEVLVGEVISGDLAQTADLTILHGLVQLKSLTESAEYDQAIARSCAQLATRPELRHSPYLLHYQAEFYDALGDTEKALQYFSELTSMPNMRWWWYFVSANVWLGDHYAGEDDSKRAMRYYQAVVDGGWNIGGQLDYAAKRLEELAK